jgi:hypothetical protein
LKQAIDERKQVVSRIPVVIDDIIETATIDNINETTTAIK